MMTDHNASMPPARPRRSFRKWVNSTSRRTFCILPLVVLAVEAVLAWLDLRDPLVIVPWGLPLLLWGYLQYRLGGGYRTRHGGGGPGLDVPPERIVDTGIYRFIRNPMYLGHMIFIAGLAVTLRSWTAAVLLAMHAIWFDNRVRGDEDHLERLFGADYAAYKARTKRWIPFIY